MCYIGKAVVKPEWIGFLQYKLILHRATRLLKMGFESDVKAFISLISVMLHSICTAFITEMAIFG